MRFGQIRVLLVEDDPAHSELISRSFEHHEVNVTITLAQTLRQARTLLERTPPDVALVDVGLPDGRGLDLLPDEGVAGDDFPFPLVIMTSQGDQKTAVEAMRRGALDYVVKSDVAFIDMPHTITRVVREWTTIMEKALAQQARDDSEARLAGILDIAPQAIISMDGTSRITIFNQGASQIFGYSADEVVGQPLEILLPLHVRAAHASYVEGFAEARESRRRMAERREVTGRRKDGSEFPAEAAISKLVRENDVTYTVILEDVTERRAREEQLRQAQKMDALGQLTSGIAHDFNNILAVTMGNLEILAEDVAHDPALMDMAQEALSSSRRGASLAHRLLAFARQQTLAPQRLNINDVVEEMGGMLRRTLESQVEVEVKLEPSPWECIVDPGELENVLLNLCINARDAMDRRGRLTIETRNVVLGDEVRSIHPDAIPGNHVVLSVTDTGCGMSPEVLAHVFEPFFTTKERGKGTGLGMSMVYGFVKQSRGHVDIDTEVGRGTTIHIYLPQAGSDEIAARQIPKDAHAPSGNGECVLVVDDDAGLRKLTTKILHRMGYTHMSASTAEDAWRRLEAHPEIRMVISDVSLPGAVSGLDLATRIADEHPDLPILIVSGVSEAVVRESGGGWPFLPKPYSREALARKIHELLDGAGTARD
ncbi:MAG: response regulator [Gemmatimonadota bacterium]|nr:response regulator [Gemmatimonadota bacterium]MDH5760592.1 response regulator [Gemmatimonadota bacterium]